MTKRYYFINRKTGKKAIIKGAVTRDEARFVKKVLGFKVDIFDTQRGEVIR